MKFLLSPKLNRRSFLKHAGLGIAALSLPGCLRRAGKSTKRPNIIFIIADDLGYGELGCYGQKIIKTPNIDELAAEGMRFTQHYAGSPVCAPSRCVLMTGKHTGHAYIRNNGRPRNRKHEPEQGIFAGQNPIPDSEVTIAELLRQQGYTTAAVGKWGLGYIGSEGDPNNQGFDLFYGYNCQVHAHNHYPRFLFRNDKREMLEGNDRTLNGKQYSQDLFIKEAKLFISKNKNRPFFLYLPFIIPHLAIQAPEESLNEYKGIIPEEPYERRGYLKHPFPRAGYAAMITHMDRGIGEILELVKELGLEKNTLVFFTSDNGPTSDRLAGSDSVFFRSAGPFRGFKGGLYEGGIRVPMVVRWPGHVKPGTTSHHVSAFWDVLPTLCEITGTELPDDRDGESFASTLLGSGQKKQHDFLYWEFPAYGGQQAVRMGNWKAIRTGLKRKNADTSIQLYNLKNDMGEKNNVADRHPEVVEQFREIMRSARTESELFPLPEINSRKM